MFIPSLLIDLKKAKATGIDIKETITSYGTVLTTLQSGNKVH